ncbi:Cytochrome [Capsicum chinense]|nr:Cytochrome [Capsicum chinense]
MKVDSMSNEIEKLNTNEVKVKSKAMNQLTQQCVGLFRLEDIKIPELKGDIGTLHKNHNVYQSTIAGKNCFGWLGPKPAVLITEPELIREVLTKNYIYHKARSSPLSKLGIGGIVSYEEDKWATQRRILNPAFHLDKLKNFFWFLVISWKNGWRLPNAGNEDLLPSFRPILRINIADRSFKGSVNSLEPPPPCQAVDDDFIDYENDGDHPINTEDDSMCMKDILSDSQDDEEDRGKGSQPGHSFTDGANFHIDQTFVDKKVLKILLDAAAVRHISIGNAFSRVYSRAYHGLCMRNLAENLRINQYYGEHLYLLYTIAKTYTIDEFSDHFAELKNNSPEAAHVLKNVLSFEK